MNHIHRLTEERDDARSHVARLRVQDIRVSAWQDQA